MDEGRLIHRASHKAQPRRTNPLASKPMFATGMTKSAASKCMPTRNPSTITPTLKTACHGEQMSRPSKDPHPRFREGDRR